MRVRSMEQMISPWYENWFNKKIILLINLGFSDITRISLKGAGSFGVLSLPGIICMCGVQLTLAS